jgi:hypothetical protein
VNDPVVCQNEDVIGGVVEPRLTDALGKNFILVGKVE